MANPDREGGGGLSLRTLAIASAASMTAAMLTSRLFPPGTMYAAALTPVIVAAVTELLNRPAERVTQLRQQRRTMVLESARFEKGRVYADEPSPLRGAPDFAHGAYAQGELDSNGSGDQPPIRVYGRERERGSVARRARQIHPKVWLATGAVAFAVAVAALTLPELIFGGAVASEDRTTFFGGGDSDSSDRETDTETTTEPTQAETETAPSQTPPAETQTETAPTPAETQTETTPAPSGGAPAPTESGTQTTPTPGGALAPVP